MVKVLLKGIEGFYLYVDYQTEIIEVYNKKNILVQLTTIQDLKRELELKKGLNKND